MNQVEHHQCDVAIIGAGIGGLATAAQLTDRYPGISISVFDAAHAPGGRIHSKRCARSSGADQWPANDVFELGAGRYHQIKHKRVHALVSALGLPSHSFHYGMDRLCSAPAASAVDGSLRQLQAAAHNTSPTSSFRSVACAVLGEAVFEALVHLSGYDALRFEEMPFECGLGILTGHPETQSIWSTDWSGWRALSNGFSGLTEALADSVGRRQQLFFRHQAVHVATDSAKTVHIEFRGPNGAMQVHAGQLICATPLFDFLKLYQPAKAMIDYAGQVVDVPLLKGYIRYDKAWWPQQADRTAGLLGRCLVVPDGFRKIYFSASQPTLWFYCDGPSAVALRERLASGTAADLLASDIGHLFNEGADATVVDSGWTFWERGISFWAGGLQRVTGPVWQPAPNIYFQSDINTPALGWMEGALMAAEAAADRVPFSANTAKGRRIIAAGRSRPADARRQYEAA